MFHSAVHTLSTCEGRLGNVVQHAKSPAEMRKSTVEGEEARPSISGWHLPHSHGDFESALWPDSVFTSFRTTCCILTLVWSLKLFMSETPSFHTAFRGLGNEFLKSYTFKQNDGF